MVGKFGAGVIGTGWLVGPKTVITAGHCVYSQFYFGGWANQIEIMPGCDGSNAPFGQLISTRFSAGQSWVETGDRDFDIGCIHLEEAVGNQVGWFSVAAPNADKLQDQMINVSGYPIDIGDGRLQYHDANRIRQVTNLRIFYDVDTFAGQSGAPSWIQEDIDAPPTVVGIHTYGPEGTPPELHVTANSATRINPDVLQQIKDWVTQDGG